MRPGGTRRRSSWCPECAAGAVPVRVKPAVSPEQRAARLARPRRASRRATRGTKPLGTAPLGTAPLGTPHLGTPPFGVIVEPKPGEAFLSHAAPKPASAAEARLRAMLAALLDVDVSLNAVRVRQPFFERLEVWPDIPIPELKVAVEYDTTGRDGLEHVGRREETDRHKDRLLRQVGWEVLRIRCGKLQPLGPYDIDASGVSGALVARLIDRLGDIRGELIVRSYLRESRTPAESARPESAHSEP